MIDNAPDWVPQVKPGSNILLAGASGGIGRSIITMLARGPECTVGAHRFSAAPNWPDTDGQTVIDLQARLGTEADCKALVAYLLSGWAGFITGQMLGITGGNWL